jgi:hypothetical protein
MNAVRPLACALSCLLLSLLVPARSHACKCMLQSVEQAKEQASAIFEGHVSEVASVPVQGDPNFTQTRATLKLVRVWKGLDKTETVEVTTASETAACGFPFEKGQSYLVYADKGEQGYTVSLCSRTRPMAEAAEDLAALGGGVTPVEVPAADKAAAPAPAKAAAPKGGGCAASASYSTSSKQAALLWLGAPALGLVWMRRRRR